MKALVTGGAGFIGSHIAERLAREGHHVEVVDNLSTGKRENLAHLGDAVRLHVGDVRDANLLARLCRGCEVVFHEAAVVSVPYTVDHPEASAAVNIGGTFNVLCAARAAGVRRVVFAASAAAYGNDPELPKRESMRPVPESPYALEKIAGEHYMQIFSKLYGVQAVSLRYFNVFGPRQDPSSPYSGVISIFVDRLRAGRTPTVFGDGEQCRDFVYVDNVVDANMLAARVPEADGQVLNIGCGRRTTLNELLAHLAESLGADPTARHEAPRPGDVRASVADISRAREVLGYEPKVDVGEGLRRLIAWTGA